MTRTIRSLLAVVGLVGLTVVSASAGTVSDPGGRTLEWVRFDSDAPIDEEGLLQMLPLRPGAPVERRDLDESWRLLDAKGTFHWVEIEVVPQEDTVGLLIHLQRKRIINRVQVRGQDQLKRKEARRLIRLAPGMIFEPELIDGAAKRLETRYGELGFPEVQVEVTPTLRPGEIDLLFQITEGTPLVVTAVVVGGETGLPRERLEEELSDFIGAYREVKQDRAVERALLRVLRRHKFYEARVLSSWQAASGNEGVLWIEVTAGPQHQLTVVGNEAKDEDDLLELIDLNNRLIITEGTWRQLARRMVSAYREAGYPLAQVRVAIEEGPVKHVRFEVTEGDRYRIRHVLFQGNESLRDDQLRPSVVTRPPNVFGWPWFGGGHAGVLLDDVLDEDARRIELAYETWGFESAEVYEVVRWLDEEEREISVVFFIEEGLQTFVEDLRLVGVGPLGAQVPDLGVQAGNPLNDDRVEEGRRRLLQAFRQRGYNDAGVEASVERKEAGQGIEARVTYAVEAGPQRRIGAVVVQTNIDTRDRVVLRELSIKSGDPLDSAALTQAQADVYRTGLFRTVSVEPLPPREALERDVGVRVVERAPGKLAWGAGYNTRDGLTGAGELTYDNLGGMARQVSLRGRVSLKPGEFVPDQYLGGVGFREPRLADSVWTYRANLAGERSTKSVDQFNIEHISLVNSFDRPVLPRVRSGVELEVDRANVFDVADDAVLIPEDEGWSWTVALSPFIFHDGRDDPFSPRKGVFESLRLRWSLPEISSVHFVKASAEHSHYIPIVDDLILVYVLRGGWGVALDGSDTVPIRERFFLGGRNTVRGFSEDSISPIGDDGGEQGGDLSLNANVELRFPLLYGFGGAFFWDGGGAYLMDESISMNDFRRSAGFSLRYETPVGPLSLDYGIKLDRRGGEDFGKFHFSVGARF